MVAEIEFMLPCTTPDTSKSQPTAYCFAQLKQGTCLIQLNSFKCERKFHLAAGIQ